MLATENGFRAILDSLLEGCQIIDRNWRYVYVNQAVASHGQTVPAALIGRTMMEAYPGIESSALFPILERSMRERIPATFSNEFAFADGSTGVFELRVQPVPEGIFILSIDVTEKKRAEDALANERKRLEKDRRCSSWSHLHYHAAPGRQGHHPLCKQGD
ncbi:MAG: PAS domain-containing protein [Anaerolineales bacterium]|nr:PAS domain-containing protein [Anaerolineales bacterium]